MFLPQGCSLTKSKNVSQGRDDKYVQILVKNPKERDHLENLGANDSIILRWILDKQNVNCGLDSSCLGQGLVVWQFLWTG
jgi:hypothetical protein